MGAHIQSLLLTLFYNYMPELIKKGKVFITVPPLYLVTMGNEIKYLKDDAALREFKKNNKNKKYTIDRFKGFHLWVYSIFQIYHLGIY